MSREPEDGTLKSLRHYILQMIERNPGVQGETKKSKCVYGVAFFFFFLSFIQKVSISYCFRAWEYRIEYERHSPAFMSDMELPGGKRKLEGI